ncbi:hypothetical protein BDV34DRAFT_217765 [Aspergillus parasiticus]|uniref:Uncharacterized protein n=1 Tax=Aspergillus parasiticus TaxID=5067 RepID=A0A5N6D4B4_ASPPA|nr:hypothetical protein BDV34DRAFT_217765 [Aspergillus parasiticus]
MSKENRLEAALYAPIMMNQGEVINDHATDVASAQHKCTANCDGDSSVAESGAEESGEDGHEPANVYGSDLDFQEKWRDYHLKREKTMEVKSITSP